MQALYAAELNPQPGEPRWDLEFEDEETRSRLDGTQLQTVVDFAKTLYEGVADRKHEIDARLNAAFDRNRTIELTAPVDRCILRLAAFEMIFIKTPKAVVISQALELGNKYGDVKTTAFLNGVLDHLQTSPEADAASF